MSTAGASAAKRRTWLSAGCGRICGASNEKRPSTGTANSPAKTSGPAGRAAVMTL